MNTNSIRFGMSNNFDSITDFSGGSRNRSKPRSDKKRDRDSMMNSYSDRGS